MSLPDGFMRVSKAVPCPICEKPDWCLVDNEDPSNPSKVLCQRIESRTKWGDAGWLHKLRDDGWRPHGRRDSVRKFRMCPTGRSSFENLSKEFQADCARAQICTLARELEVSTLSLDLLGIGTFESTWTFPMQDGAGTVIGIHRRGLNGVKFCIPDSRLGLFVPRSGPEDRHLWICEGASDTATLLTLKLRAIGRPSSSSGVRFLAKYVRLARPTVITIVSDSDSAGLGGASCLASTLLAFCPDVRIIVPPPGVKDVREWVRAGAVKEDLLRAANAALPKGALIGQLRNGGQA